MLKYGLENICWGQLYTKYADRQIASIARPLYFEIILRRTAGLGLIGLPERVLYQRCIEALGKQFPPPRNFLQAAPVIGQDFAG